MPGALVKPTVGQVPEAFQRGLREILLHENVLSMMSTMGCRNEQEAEPPQSPFSTSQAMEM